MTDTAYTSGFRAGMQHAAELTYADNIAYTPPISDLDAWVCSVATGGRVQLDQLDTMPATRWTDEPHIVRGLE